MKRKGKVICQHLKEVRRNIATENGIPLEIPTPTGSWTLGEKCHYKGECSGTCPRCEAEMRYLEEQLSQRISLGKIATVAGLALGLATGAQAQQDNPQKPVATKDTLVKIERPAFQLFQDNVEDYTIMEENTGTTRGEGGVTVIGIRKRRVDTRTPWEIIQDPRKYLLGGVGTQDMGHGNVEVERRGPLLIVVEPEEPQL